MAKELQILALAASRLPIKQLESFREFAAAFEWRGQELFRAVIQKKELPENLSALADPRELEMAGKDIYKWSKLGVRFVALGEEAYPSVLARIYKPPLYLTFQGSLPPELTSFRALAVVGSRRADVEGEKISSDFALTLSARGVCIVSGLALGVDAAAHRGALQARAEFPTIAVLGNGLQTIYPPGNRDLAAKILDQGGLLLSQFEVDEKPYPRNFLERNRIIAALAQAVLVVQAGERSGSLVTARYALELGREVLVVPGSILGRRYVGSNRLIQQGAVPVTCAEDVRDALSEIWQVYQERPGAGARSEQTFKFQHPVLALLGEMEQLTVIEIRKRLGRPKDIEYELLKLELQGLIERRPGNMIALKRPG